MNNKLTSFTISGLLFFVISSNILAKINPCPDNSNCTDKSMALYESFSKKILNINSTKDIKNIIIPNYGYKDPSKITTEELYWKDCPGNSSVKVMFFSNNLFLPDIIHKPFLRITKGLVKNDQNPYYLPFTESPLFIYKNSIFFIKQIKNKYYYASVSNNGEFKISQNLSAKTIGLYEKLKKENINTHRQCQLPKNFPLVKTNAKLPSQEYSPQCLFVANLNNKKFEKYLTFRRHCLRD
ncbi:hypothetical protein N9N67_02345 [Bacteriovoracaceae bacterium]|nr:hypothetical protein [Bacteriovoracaceae bacterium]